MAYTVKSGGSMATTATGGARTPLSRARVLDEAIGYADAHGLDALSMRTLAERLDVVPMALYKHVRAKEALIDGMVETVLAALPAADLAGVGPETWRAVARSRILAARSALQRHPWMWRALETRAAPTPAMLDHMEAMIQILRRGGLGPVLTHHAMHALGGRIWGFTPEVASSGPAPTDPAQIDAAMAAMRERWPGVLESAMSARHEAGSAVGPGCDDDAEFAFALDLLLDGVESRHSAGWPSLARATSH
ncbi:TetR/AcrR family transcriptional regulator [Demequina lignilytica]|uniref:TetR/AcrR family transcriptional regulator n=1 Tax=Demequina lignilytica TaxID=3051663 RepID=A0AB35MH29_9MICO|nr:TetR/AcrR family transcriptional regulator [Demequina sp. SYSU T0a273]MDN4483083.1 TetR/AcrR family transcriptional regulator [Demequina sp. SYSU T0a273]